MRKRWLAMLTAIPLSIPIFLSGNAHAATVAASPWTQLWVTAESGGGCAAPQPDLLNPVLSEPCTTGDWWYGRILNFNNGQVQWNTFGAQLEFVNPSKTLALGFSGGQYKMETPSDSSTYVLVGGADPTNIDWTLLGAPPAGSSYMEPNGKGLPLKPVTGALLPPDGWTECSTDQAYCDYTHA